MKQLKVGKLSNNRMSGENVVETFDENFLVSNIFSQKANARFCGSHKECFRTKAAAFFSSQRVNKSQEGGLRDNLLLSNVNQGIHTISSFHHDS